MHRAIFELCASWGRESPRGIQFLRLHLIGCTSLSGDKVAKTHPRNQYNLSITNENNSGELIRAFRNVQHYIILEGKISRNSISQMCLPDLRTTQIYETVRWPRVLWFIASLLMRKLMVWHGSVLTEVLSGVASQDFCSEVSLFSGLDSGLVLWTSSSDLPHCLIRFFGCCAGLWSK